MKTIAWVICGIALATAGSCPAGAQIAVWPGGISAGVDASGNVYSTDGNNIYKLDHSSGKLTEITGSGNWYRCIPPAPSFSPSLTPVCQVAGLSVDAAGNVFFAENYYSVVQKVTTDGTILTVAGSGQPGYSGNGGPATQANMCPIAAAVDTAGDVYIVDNYAWWCSPPNAMIREVTPDGIIHTVAGNGSTFPSGDGGPATQAGMDPNGVAADAAGNFYISDGTNCQIRKVDTHGIISTVAGISGRAVCYYSGDGGPATQATLGYITGLAVNAAGVIYILDGARIRRVALDGTITTVAGNGTLGYTGDGGPATSAEISPAGIALDSAGNLYLTDDVTLRVVSTDGNIRTLVGPPQPMVLMSPAYGATGVLAPVLTWQAAPWATSYDVYFGSGPSPFLVANTTATSYTPGPLDAGTYYWQVVAKNNPPTVTDSSAVWSFVEARNTTPPAAPVLVSPANGASGVIQPVLTWNAASGATSYDVYFGTSPVPPLVTNTTATSYPAGLLQSGATYYWQVAARNDDGTTASGTWSFTAGPETPGLLFSPGPVTRLVDTRFSRPSLAAGETRQFLSGSGWVSAYSLNVTVVPKGPLHNLTVWPAGQPQPGVPTLSSLDGQVVANAAIVPTGDDGGVNVYASDPTDVILDTSGWLFDASGAGGGYSFYPVTPCRVADTRGPAGLFTGPSLVADQARDFPFTSSECGLPAAGAYALNVTAIPDPLTHYLGYLAISGYPGTGGTSILNSWDGRVVANAAIASTFGTGDIWVYVPQQADLILDTSGYFGDPGGQGALLFYPVTPCRVADTRGADGPFGGPILGGGETRSFTIPAGSCYVPSNAGAYLLNITAVPDPEAGFLGYLTVWPAGSPQPLVSTLNSWNGAVVANAAIVPAGTNRAINVFVTNPTHVILDINGYFAP